MVARFEMQKTPSGHYLFNLKAGNGRVILTSEPHRRRSDALNSIQAVRENAVRPEWYERRTAAGNMPYFVLTAAKGRVLGCGDFYASHRAMEEGIRAVMTSGPLAALVDLSHT